MSNEINYEEFFPEDGSAGYGNEPKDTYIVQISLNGPIDSSYNFLTGKGCNDRNISDDIEKAIEYFNEGIMARKKDLGEIINPKIRSKDIIFTLLFKHGVDKSIKGVIGNSISKFLFHDMNWDGMVNDTGHKVNKRLLNVEFHKIDSE